MAFINEPISAEAKATFDFTVFRSMFGGFHKFKDWQLDRWAVDIDRNAKFLYVMAGGGAHVDAPHVCRHALWWNGSVAYFDAEDQTEWDRVSSPIISWLNSKIVLPKALHAQADEVVAMITEAVHAMGWSFSQELNPTVIISGKPTIIFATEF
jgi:hypothetical protein